MLLGVFAYSKHAEKKKIKTVIIFPCFCIGYRSIYLNIDFLLRKTQFHVIVWLKRNFLLLDQKKKRTNLPKHQRILQKKKTQSIISYESNWLKNCSSIDIRHLDAMKNKNQLHSTTLCSWHIPYKLFLLCCGWWHFYTCKKVYRWCHSFNSSLRNQKRTNYSTISSYMKLESNNFYFFSNIYDYSNKSNIDNLPFI